MTDWDDLRFVLACARNGGVTGAARALRVNHSTVSRRIESIESRIGARLFDRLPAGYAPTEAGLEAVAAAEEMEAAAAALDRQIAGRDRGPSGTVTLTTTLIVLMGPISEALTAFRKRYPDIDLKVLITNDLLNLHRREADLAIRPTDSPDESLVGVRLAEVWATAYAAPSYLDGRDLARDGLDWIGFPDIDSPSDECLALYPGSRVGLRMDDKLAMVTAAKAGLGACRMPCFHGDPDPDLVRVPGFGLSRYSHIWVLTHRDLRRVERIRLLMRWIAEAMRGHKALFRGDAIAS